MLHLYRNMLEKQTPSVYYIQAFCIASLLNVKEEFPSVGLNYDFILINNTSQASHHYTTTPRASPTIQDQHHRQQPTHKSTWKRGQTAQPHTAGAWPAGGNPTREAEKTWKLHTQREIWRLNMRYSINKPHILQKNCMRHPDYYTLELHKDGWQFTGKSRKYLTKVLGHHNAPWHNCTERWISFIFAATHPFKWTRSMPVKWFHSMREREFCSFNLYFNMSHEFTEFHIWAQSLFAVF